jgi:2-hydroxychromene-2-carboxylate isomerase
MLQRNVYTGAREMCRDLQAGNYETSNSTDATERIERASQLHEHRLSLEGSTEPPRIREIGVIEFFFDCSSPWTYLAFHNIQRLAAETNTSIAWRPILVGGIFNAINPSVQAARNVRAKAEYLKKDLTDWARLTGLEIKMLPTVFPVNSVKAMRGCILLEKSGRLVEFATLVFQSYWTHDEDISLDSVLAAIVERLECDPDEFLEGIARPDIKNALRQNTDELMQRGGFGTPTIFVHKTDMYFGNDRLPLVRNALLTQQ